jgi:hypothetical protein
MRERRPGDGNRLSPQTLIVASLASLTAAIVTSYFWQRGTPITAAITPVIVALASELYSRPARRITELSSRAGTRSRRFDPVEQVARERAAMGGRSSWANDDDAYDDRPPPIREPGTGPIRVYRTGGGSTGGGGRRNRINPKVAIATAAIAFAIAAAALTLPELVFGGSVASHGRTTFFGGSHHNSTKKKSEKTQTTPTTSDQTQSTPTVTVTTPQQAPAQTAPQTTTPTPATPTPGTQSPTPSGGQPPGSGTTTPGTPTP